MLAGFAGICTFVFERDDDFLEIQQFNRQMEQQYNLHIEVLHGDFKSGIEALLQRTQIEAIILGTRR